MHKHYIPVAKLFDYISFEKTCSFPHEKIKKHEMYIKDKNNSFFAWKKNKTDAKIIISKCILCKFGEEFEKLKSLKQLLVEKEKADEIFSISDRLKKTAAPITETLRVYQQCNDILVERADIFVTGIAFEDDGIRSIGGMLEISELNDESEVFQKMIRKYVHDIKNQLTVMLSAASNIQNSSSEREIKKNAYFIKDTAYSCNYMLSLMKSDKKIEKSYKLFNMHQVIKSLLDSFKCEDDINFSVQLDAKNPRIYANKVLITNAIYNVMINAIQSLEHKGNIAVRTYNGKKNPVSDYSSTQWLFLEITDDGMGIDEDIKDKIFEQSYTTKIYGSGLGLYSANTTMLQHKGTISVKAQKGEATSFIICLPSHIE